MEAKPLKSFISSNMTFDFLLAFSIFDSRRCLLDVKKNNLWIVVGGMGSPENLTIRIREDKTREDKIREDKIR